MKRKQAYILSPKIYKYAEYTIPIPPYSDYVEKT